MALQKCKECGKEVSNKAEKCPNCGAPIKKRSIGCGGVLLILILVIFFGSIIDEISQSKQTKRTSASLNKKNESEYYGPWKSDFNIGITKALAKNNISGCGEYKYRKHNNKTKYIVRCTPDGINWKSYRVYVGSDKVIGPYNIDHKYD